MTDRTLPGALRRLNYVPCDRGLWLKPVGYVLFTYEDARAEWTCWYRGPNGEIGRWNSQKYHHEPPTTDPLRWLKDCEAWHSRLCIGDGLSAFELRDPEPGSDHEPATPKEVRHDPER